MPCFFNFPVSIPLFVLRRHRNAEALGAKSPSRCTHHDANMLRGLFGIGKVSLTLPEPLLPQCHDKIRISPRRIFLNLENQNLFENLVIYGKGHILVKSSIPIIPSRSKKKRRDFWLQSSFYYEFLIPSKHGGEHVPWRRLFFSIRNHGPEWKSKHHFGNDKRYYQVQCDIKQCLLEATGRAGPKYFVQSNIVSR